MLDVRENDELRAAGHAPCAVHVPMGQVLQRLDELASRSPIARCGWCAAPAGDQPGVTAALQQAGWDVVNVDGGMRAWAAAGRPMVAESHGTPSGAAPRVL